MYTLLVTGDVPGASTYFNPLLQQSIIPCTSGTRPSSPNDGMLAWETDTERYTSWNATLGAWVPLGQMITTTVTPSLTASTTNPTLGSGNTATARYTLWNGKMCTYWGYIQFGTTSVNAGSGQYFISLPFAAAVGPNFTPGSALIRRNSPSDIRNANCYLSQGASTLSLVGTDVIITSSAPWGVNWAASDYMHWSITYEIA